TPDTYVVHKKDWKILDKNISQQKMMIIQCLKQGTKRTQVPKSKQEKQKLTDLQIIKLAKLCVNIERHYKKPQDIEWAFIKGKFYIIQSRPITTL
ncbi:phosphoenolpyruvate synthase, partial [Patescibacteria group bacterium]|nr:phosphoenolpyruvate synthase [Patescibacteria group bacterium]